MSQSKPGGLPLGATPGKLALVAVLALVMIGVIASNWPSDESGPVDDTVGAVPETAAASSSPSVAGAEPPPPPPPTGPFGEFAVDQHWPERPLKEVTSYDPLAASEWVRPPAVAEGPVYNEEQINDLLAAQNAIIFVAGDKRIARIGDKEFQVGDEIGRYTISDITAKGVVLNESE
jgi:hypothetical protein